MENNQKIVLVPTDFSEVCDNAINYAVETAKAANYKIYLLHVIDKNTKTSLKKEGLTEESITVKLKSIADRIKAEEQLDIETISLEGNIFTTIGEVAKEIKANLLILGTHGKVGMQKLTGSFALRVVTSSPAPVIIVQKRPVKGFNDIVLPITSDSGPWEKTKWATFIAKTFNSTIHIYHTGGEEVDKAINIITDHFTANTVQFTVKKSTKSGDFSAQVLDYSTSLNSDLIMIMTNPDKGFSTFILGSYDEEMIFNNSQIPVMCINPREFNWTKIVEY